jgi:hypothetical protein
MILNALPYLATLLRVNHRGQGYEEWQVDISAVGAFAESDTRELIFVLPACGGRRAIS